MGMQTRSGKKKPKVPTPKETKQAPEALVGRIGAIFARRSDLGDDLDEGEQRKVAAGKDHAHFDRVRVDEGTFTPEGLKGSTTFQNSKRFREKNSPAEDRAVCVVTSRMSAALEAHAAATPLRKPVSFGPGRLGEQLWVESDTLDTSVVCVGDEFGVFRGGADAPAHDPAGPRNAGVGQPGCELAPEASVRRPPAETELSPREKARAAAEARRKMAAARAEKRNARNAARRDPPAR